MTIHSRPWMNWLLIAANLAVFRFQMTRPWLMGHYMLDAHTLRTWEFLSYAFLHVGPAHLICNLFILALLGNAVNQRLGHIGYLGFYLGGAAASGIGFVLAGGQAMVGASGAVGAVMGAYLALLPTANIAISLIFATLEVPSMFFVVAFFLYNVVMSLAFPVAIQQVAYEAHIAGMLFGFLVTLALLLSRLLPPGSSDFPAMVRHWYRRHHYQTLLAAGYIPFDHAPAPASGPSDQRMYHITDLRSKIATAIAQRNLPQATDLFRQLKGIDPRQFLSRQAQLDVANQLSGLQLYAEAAEAYEQFLEHYATFDQIEQVHLMLGLLYARYLNRHVRARECLAAALPMLKDPQQIDMARTELAKMNLPSAWKPVKPSSTSDT